MIEDVKLRLAKRRIENTETKGGEVQYEVFILKGLDEANGVEWSVTLKAEEEMPEFYKMTIGKRIGDNTMVSLDKSTQQTEL